MALRGLLGFMGILATLAPWAEPEKPVGEKGGGGENAGG